MAAVRGEDARGDEGDQSVQGSREMALQAELSLSEFTLGSIVRGCALGDELRSGSFARLGLRSSPPRCGGSRCGTIRVMPIPDFETLMRPLLEELSSHDERDTADL